MSLILVAKDRSQVSSAVKDADDLNTFRERHVEDHVVAHGNTSEVGCQLGPAASDAGAASQRLELRVNEVCEGVGLVSAVLGDVRPNLGEIDERSGAYDNGGILFAGGGCAGGKAFAAFAFQLDHAPWFRRAAIEAFANVLTQLFQAH